MKVIILTPERHYLYWHFLSLLATLAFLLLQTQSAVGFLAVNTLSVASNKACSKASTAVYTSFAEGNEVVNGFPQLSGALADAQLHQFELNNHKPLGCSVEESLASEPDGAKYVFVAQVNEGGYAEKAGIEVGDVIVQLSGTFDEVVDVTGLGIEKIRSLVSGRPVESPLIIRIARGSDVMERHEMALVDLCIVGDERAAENCINSIYETVVDVGDIMSGDGDMAACDDDGTECLLDSLWDSWADGLPIPSEIEEKEEDISKNEKKKVAPWSSRSSPSGTYVRDPKTGVMRNIDE